MGTWQSQKRQRVCERVEQVVAADDTCLSGLIQQPLERRTADKFDDGPSHRRRGGRCGSSHHSSATNARKRATYLRYASTTTNNMHSMWCPMHIVHPTPPHMLTTSRRKVSHMHPHANYFQEENLSYALSAPFFKKLAHPASARSG